ncbi:uncharacterized protein BX664DRAFT_322113 [Halteromyces radiatus]|uniref:uncharacterized protein n=1 Tax=Halteromyces radiatus TaxID=101107 RepID=UPI00221F2DFA|nr:uncharacterized protein BX664DRAFT_322113 [Halteromyces radiatus]KAI8099785.1 hypothetical protein BX664DRAFT_322113 [Halteromyces radiatus]
MHYPSAIYPLKGFIFFIQHPKELWLKTLLPLLLTLGFGIVSLVVAIVYLLPWQVHSLEQAHWPSWIAWFVAIILVILESAIFDILCYAILLPFFQDAVFDATLQARGLLDRISIEQTDPIWIKCGRSLSSSIIFIFFVVLARVLVLIITLPLNLIPIIGTILTCYINGFPACWGLTIHHDLELRGMKVRQSLRGAWSHRLAYINFGALQTFLELIPIANLIFMWTNIVGAALWLGDEFERSEQSIPSNEASVTSIYPSVRGDNSVVPSINSNEHTRLIQQKDQGYGSSTI